MSGIGLSDIKVRIKSRILDDCMAFTAGRTPGSSFNTPAGASSARGGPLSTPLRDKLNINPEESLEGAETPHAVKQLKEQLRAGLSSLPAPKNDYEIVVPEDEALPAAEPESTMVEDQTDVDARLLAEQKAKRMSFYCKKKHTY